MGKPPLLTSHAPPGASYPAESFIMLHATDCTIDNDGIDFIARGKKHEITDALRFPMQHFADNDEVNTSEFFDALSEYKREDVIEVKVLLGMSTNWEIKFSINGAHAEGAPA